MIMSPTGHGDPQTATAAAASRSRQGPDRELENTPNASSRTTPALNTPIIGSGSISARYTNGPKISASRGNRK